MRYPRFRSVLALAAMAAFAASQSGRLTAEEPLSATEKQAGFRLLFDGETLAGWEGNEAMFRVADGAVVAGSAKSPIPHNDFLCTKETFANFELRLEAKLTGQGDNAGVQFRSRRVPNHHEVSGYQCDIGASAERPIWGSLYDESRRRRMLAEPAVAVVDKALKPDDWNAFTIRCEGPRVRIWLNDELTVDYTEEDDAIDREGVIGLQIHSGPPAEAHYRHIRIAPLEDRP